MLADKIEEIISQYHGLNTRQSKALLSPGFSYAMHDIDLSSPGIAKTRGGSETLVITGSNISSEIMSGSSINSLFDHFIPSTNEHIMLFNFSTFLAKTDENGNGEIILSGTTAGETFDYVSFGDLAFCGNGEDDNYVVDETSVRLWGITAPTTKPTVAAGAAGVLAGTYLYKYAYVNSSTGHISNGSSVSSSVSPSSEKVNISDIVASTDTQVDKINIYRTTDGGATFLYLAQIDNGTTTYEDNIADTALGTTQAPSENYRPPVNFFALEEWDGRIWGFGKNTTILWRSNTDAETVTGEGQPEESFGAFNYYDFKGKIYGIRKSPNEDELVVHTSKGIYAMVKTGVIDAPYIPVLRNSEWYSISHKALVNVDTAQYGINEKGKVFVYSGGEVNYESYLIEPTISGEGNLAAYNKAVAVNYSSGEKNQYRIVLPQTGQSTPNRMFNANYRQRVPVTQEGFSFPSWEVHNISAVSMTTFTNASRESLLYIGTADGKIKRIDYGTNDDGVAIDWSFSIGWLNTGRSPFKHCLLKKILAWMQPQGSYTLSAITKYDFGRISGNIYPIQMISTGSIFGTFKFGEKKFSAGNSLSLIEIDLCGDYKYAEVTFYGNGLNEVLNLQTLSFVFDRIQGSRIP